MRMNPGGFTEMRFEFRLSAEPTVLRFYPSEDYKIEFRKSTEYTEMGAECSDHSSHKVLPLN